MRHLYCFVVAWPGLFVALPAWAGTPLAEPWQAEYAGKDETGPHVLGLWQFAAADPGADASGQNKPGKLEGAKVHPQGRFGAGLESFPGWPKSDKRHALVVPASPGLSPRGAFTLELWVNPGPESRATQQCYLIDKKYVAHTDYQLTLHRPKEGGPARLRLNLGFGADSAAFVSDETPLEPGTWHHLACTYDGAGRVRFFVNGRALGGGTQPGRGDVAPGTHPLSIGDRLGSNYGGFPGRIDQVRLSRGVLAFSPLAVRAEFGRTTYVRGEAKPTLRGVVTNQRRTRLEGAKAAATLDGRDRLAVPLPGLEPGGEHAFDFPLDTMLRPGTYELRVELEAPGEAAWSSAETFPLTIVPRPLPERMPVVMWGLGGTDGVLRELDRLKDLGFTHCLGLSVDYGAVWKAGRPTATSTPEGLRQGREMLDEALARDVGIVVSLSPGSWARSRPEWLRVGRDGKPYDREDVNGLFPDLQRFCENVGASVAADYGAHPALQAALVHTEVRDGAQLSFHDIDRQAYRAFAGADIPAEAKTRYGVPWTTLKDFPRDRVVPDDHPLLRYFRWYWKEGEGWGSLNTAVHRGLQTAKRSDFWTFHDPAVRTASVWGGAGGVDVLSQWTYSYPDPIRIAMPTDELFAMAEGGGQRVMSMTQLIWYRSQTAPVKKTAAPGGPPAGWEDRDPGAEYITIAPMHLREAFWAKIARPIQGIMFHGWGSLVPTDTPHSYRYTHPETQHELRRLVRTVVEPLGPTLRQVPAVKSDVAFLQSFASEMFARRGSYGWSSGWAADVYQVLLHAQLQPEILFEETVARRGLDGYRLLVLADCDVLPASTVRAVQEFQKRGGLVIGDERLCPAVKPAVTLPVYQRTRQADRDKAALLALAARLRQDLAGKYTWGLESRNLEVVTYRRRAGTSDYVFAVNDRREFGSYVGPHKLVMENGLPSHTELVLARNGGAVYDLVAHRPVPAKVEGDRLTIPLHLGPCEGRSLLVTARPLDRVNVTGPKSADLGGTWQGTVTVFDTADRPVDAVVPLRVEVLDPDGRPAEFSGHYGAKGGRLDLRLDVARNDVPGLWQVRATELASGLSAAGYFRVEAP